MRLKRMKTLEKVTVNDGFIDYDISYFSLYRFATKWDLLEICCGVIFTLIKVIPFPAAMVLYGEFTTLLVERTYGEGTSSKTFLLSWTGGGTILVNATKEENMNEILNDSAAFGILMTILTVIQLISGTICVDCFNRSAIRQITRIRVLLFKSLMRQEIGWYDIESSKSNLTIRLSDDVEKIKMGIAEQVSHFLYIVLSCVILVVVSFIYGWELTLIVVMYIPIVYIMNLFIGKFQAKLTKDELNAYGIAANVVEEVLGGIRTVFAFGGERVESERYSKLLTPVVKAAIRKGHFSSIADGTIRFLYFASCALSFWFGIRWVFEDRNKSIKQYTPAVLIIVFSNLITAADNIARITPYNETLSLAREAAKGVFVLIDRQSKIDSLAKTGNVLDANVKGNIEFKNISFSYPSRPDVKILNDLNLKIKDGQSVAFVGNSGNGKSTCLQLLQRFYDPNQGEVLLDGHELRSININSLRSKIASVGQEPVLFSTTIGENIRYGNPEATDEDVILAAQNSGAHDFIIRLPQGYNTMVGEKGSQLSGGQKQRIAIARALIQNPKILLLDEATSALDYQSEKYVQETLDRASKGRTTIVVSHRLSAIRNADRILFIDKGQIVEDGSHSELLALKGRYFDMIKSSDMLEEDENSKEKVAKNGEVKEDVIQEKVKTCSFDNFSNALVRERVADDSSCINYWNNFKRIVVLVKPDWKILFYATISALILGCSLPFFSIIFAEIYGTLSIRNEEEALSYVRVLCFTFFGIGCLMFVAALFQIRLFAKAGANLTAKIRSLTFAAMLKQDCEWFDDEKNAVGALTTRLSTDAANLQMAIGFPLSIILQSVSTVVLGIIISFSTSVKLSLACVMSIPAMIIIVVLEAKHLAKSEITEKNAIGYGMKIATESINNVRTIASLRQESQMIYRFINEMSKVEMIAKRKMIWRGIINSTTQAIPILAYGVALFYGGILVSREEIYYKSVIRVCEALLYGTIVMSQTLVYAPTITTAFSGAHRVFKIIDREPKVGSPLVANKSRKPDRGSDINYQKIDFRYPTRPDIQILNNFNLCVEEGMTIALVGPSGCGKSTCIQLLQRLYDPEHGRIHIGLDEISRDIPLSALRSKLSIVSQEPVLFDRSIAENIAYGDNTREVSMVEIIDAAKIANVHNFIVQLPQGYETNLGSKGAQLSGGQKQRIAIARALIRNPQVLLLDEATSALDLHSELVVQQALDSARAGRTCLVIAHRLSTIQNADLICVVQNGNIIESGTHSDLLALNGAYTRLFNAQK